MKLKTVALTGAMSLAGPGLVGVGAHAAFTTSTTSSQQVTTGTPSVTLSGSCIGTNCPGYPNGLYGLSPDGLTLTWASGGPYGSTFTTGDELVTMTNTGKIPLNEIYLDITVNGASNLEDEAYACLSTSGLGTNQTNTVVYNGPLTGLLAQESSTAQGGGPNGWSQLGDTITIAGTQYVISTPTEGGPAATGPADNYALNIYAGAEPTQCGMHFTNVAGGVTIFTLPAGGTSVHPVIAETPGLSTVPTLDNDAEGQTITASVSMSYQG